MNVIRWEKHSLVTREDLWIAMLASGAMLAKCLRKTHSCFYVIHSQLLPQWISHNFWKGSGKGEKIELINTIKVHFNFIRFNWPTSSAVRHIIESLFILTPRTCGEIKKLRNWICHIYDYKILTEQLNNGHDAAKITCLKIVNRLFLLLMSLFTILMNRRQSSAFKAADINITFSVCNEL